MTPRPPMSKNPEAIEALQCDREIAAAFWQDQGLPEMATDSRSIRFFARLRMQVPTDVVRLVVAARDVVHGDALTEHRELDAASEAFASRVPWDDEPEDAK